MNHSLGKRRQCGRQNSPRGYPSVPICSARQEQTGGCTYSRQCHCLSVDRHSRAHHVDHPWCAVGGSLERRGRNESALRSEFAQRGYRFPAAIGEACRSARFRPYAPNLRCIALLPRLRRQPAIESAQFDAPVAGELLFHPRFLWIPRLATILRRAK